MASNTQAVEATLEQALGNTCSKEEKKGPAACAVDPTWARMVQGSTE